MIRALGLKSGVISTGNSLTLSSNDEKVLADNGAVAKEMEVAAIAEVAKRYKINVMAVKGITNIVGMNANAAGEFQKNFSLATQNISLAMPKILDYVIGKTPRQLRASIALVSTTADKKPVANSTTPLFSHPAAQKGEETKHGLEAPRARL